MYINNINIFNLLPRLAIFGVTELLELALGFMKNHIAL